jgi:hypothetical protein
MVGSGPNLAPGSSDPSTLDELREVGARNLALMREKGARALALSRERGGGLLALSRERGVGAPEQDRILVDNRTTQLAITPGRLPLGASPVGNHVVRPTQTPGKELADLTRDLVSYGLAPLQAFREAKDGLKSVYGRNRDNSEDEDRSKTS